MPLQSLGIEKVDLDAMHLSLTGKIPPSSREDFPTLLLRMLEVKSMKILVTEETIIVEISGGDVCRVPRPPRIAGDRRNDKH